MTPFSLILRVASTLALLPSSFASAVDTHTLLTSTMSSATHTQSVPQYERHPGTLTRRRPPSVPIIKRYGALFYEGMSSAVESKESAATGSSGNLTFRLPLADEIIPLGEEYVVAWRTGRTGDVELKLVLVDQYAGTTEQRIYTVASVDFSASNYTWLVPSNLDPGSYVLQLMSTLSPVFILGSVAPSSSLLPSGSPKPHHGLSPGEKGGLIAGSIVGGLVVFTIAGLWWYQLRQRQKRIHAAKEAEKVREEKKDSVAPAWGGATAGTTDATIQGRPLESQLTRKEVDTGIVALSGEEDEGLTTDDKKALVVAVNEVRIQERIMESRSRPAEREQEP